MNAGGTVTLHKPGPCALLQDLGRKGWQHLGFCQSGAMDEHAFLWANKLLGNRPACAALEITLGPFACRFDSATRIALTGAAERIFLNGEAVRPWQQLPVAGGDELRFDAPARGLRTYLAVRHGFDPDSPPMGASMAVREKTGPFGGGPLPPQCSLAFRGLTPAADRHRRLATPARFIPRYDMPLHLYLYPGFQHDSFSPHYIEAFFNTEFTITSRANRMAYPLAGDTPGCRQAHLMSEGTPFGAVQIPPDGQPIILLKERQTIGGYPKIGCLSHLDCFALAQRRPGEKVRFARGNLADSRYRLKTFYTFFDLA